MQPTAQKNNAKQRKTIAIVAVIAVVAIALAAVAIIAVANKREMTQAASDTCTLNAKALATHQQNFEEAQKEAEDAAKLTVDDVRRQPAQHHQRTRRGRQGGNRQPGTQTRVRQVSRPSQTSRQGAAPSSAAPAFNGAKLRFQTTLASLKMTFATFSQPDNRPYRKSIPLPQKPERAY